MKPRNREVNVFNMSMLDVISGALGAVLIVMIILSPYYGKERTEAEYQDLQDQIREMEEDAEIGRIRNPFVVIAEWRSQKHNVDLYVAREGQVYDPTKPKRSVYEGDNIIGHSSGPGFEVAMTRDAPAGEYRIFVNLFANNGNRAEALVSMYLLYSGEFIRLPTVVLRQEKTAFLLGSLLMDGDRNLVFRGATPEIQRHYEEMQR